MIDLRDVRNVRDDWVAIGAVTLAFMLGAVSTGGGTASIVGPIAGVALGVGMIWYYDEVARIPDVPRGEAADALRRTADELDELDQLVDEAVEAEREAEDEDEGPETVVVESDKLDDLSERSGLDADDVATDGGESR